MKRLFGAISAMRAAISEGDRAAAEKAGQTMCEIYERDFNPETYTIETAVVQYECILALLELHILRGDPLDVVMKYGEFLQKIKHDKEHYPEWKEEDMRPVSEIIARAYRKVHDFIGKGIRFTPADKKYGPSCQCCLCLKNKADKKGSHLVPHMLIGDIFSYDGSRSRDKAVVEVAELSTGHRENFFGREVYDDTIQEILGRSLTDEEIEREQAKINALTRDHIFCSDCEKRFGIIESFYSDIMGGMKNYPPHIPYLFWMSVMWRMSVGGIGTKMLPEHDEKLRKILNYALALKREDIEARHSKLGHCAYSIYKAEDTKDETLGILGLHFPTKPYQALIGGFLINFYTSASSARSFCRHHGLPNEDLNCGTETEKTGILSFIEFWMAKRQILDMTWKHDLSRDNFGSQSHQTLTKLEKWDDDEMSDIIGEKVTEGQLLLPLSEYDGTPYVLPRSIRRLILWSKAHGGNMDLEQMANDTGYTIEEIAVMLDWFCKHHQLPNLS